MFLRRSQSSTLRTHALQADRLMHILVHQIHFLAVLAVTLPSPHGDRRLFRAGVFSFLFSVFSFLRRVNFNTTQHVTRISFSNGRSSGAGSGTAIIGFIRGFEQTFRAIWMNFKLAS
ncbi:uncharacterized protein EI97DRAFT_109277 [Westerdykella ornata]|uniref:Uncharacterized protein n=1 Tax=Westerdykella ornata TaxID=318751 RepID=A0A6A6JW79_WESOR|nr:uncharacterized protein EI97DRAFT_109277 [Westerdykella ornata]KAF2280068.1 hypothetical protein EI97DRAFT_109277 [Westerdykella ornata]